MGARCHIIERPATVEEMELLRGRTQRPGELVGAMLIGGMPLVFLGVASMFGLPLWVGMPLGIVLLLVAALMAIGIRRDLLEARVPAQRDLLRGRVEVLEVDGAKAVEIAADHSSTTPTFAFELEGDRTLVLLGQWIGDPIVYGCRLQGDDADCEATEDGNGLPPPYSFPATEFTLHRFPESGEVLRIDVRGAYVAPPLWKEDVELCVINDMPSRVLDCRLNDMPAKVLTMIPLRTRRRGSNQRAST